MKLLRGFFQFCVFIILTVLTQIGGIAYLISSFVASKTGVRSWYAKLLVFIAFYVAATVSANLIAPIFGRIPISCMSGEANNLAVRSPIYCLLNRNYVTPPTLNLVSALANDVNRAFPGTTTMVLDANFPFWDGFPLLPHLSHSDGRKLDIAYYYKTAGGDFVNGVTKSPIGYFAFEQPSANEEQPCVGRHDILTTRWNFDWLQPFLPDYHIEDRRMAFSLKWLATEGVQRFGLEKVFIEPHLANTLGVKDSVIRFQGCRAARHDDHIHVQIRRLAVPQQLETM
ncbi:hypothetical protein PMI09_02200 [Rhizobium sp. CF122]|uniref:hypothetical protein n=1 Tax=Rhizobium sp. CF122 TaxID=1144312 RepID=UPI000271D33F|nr:hypothetical protein [Rhizobium sp. CF122]EJL54884.1 hypothetical protein PMI09_02200 [Rhizobium sp. CF122]